MRVRTAPKRVLVYVSAIFLTIFWCGPFALVALGSVIPEGNLFSFPPHWFADPPFLGNYKYILFGEVPQTYLQRGALRSTISEEARWVPYAMFNSFVVALLVTLITLILASLAAYAYARLRFPARKGTFLFVLLSRLIPTVALAVPYYAIVQSFGLLNTRIALIAMYTALTLPFAVLILTLYFRGIPKEIDEAARVEGAGPLKNLWYVTLPLSLPSLVGAGLFTFMLAYGEFLLALLIVNSRLVRTLPVTLGVLSTNPDVSWGILMAAIMIGSVPTMLLVYPVWRFMVRGLTTGATR
ncbi:MAG: carbohydrate ABC transporter permease [Streptosporangiaceae bacterium]